METEFLPGERKRQDAINQYGYKSLQNTERIVFPLRKAGGARMAFIMIKHIVMFKLKEKAEGRDKAANIQLLKAMLDALPARIKEIKFFEVGVNFLEASIAYDLVLVSEFESLEALQSYQKHPEHLKVFDFVVKTCESRIVVDYAL